jgi:hypothetical protein
MWGWTGAGEAGQGGRGAGIAKSTETACEVYPLIPAYTLLYPLIPGNTYLYPFIPVYTR